jgi:hypothetical protein
MEGRWLVGDHTVVTLSTSEGVELARREMTRSSASDSFLGPSGLPKRLRLINPNSSEVANGDQQVDEFCLVDFFFFSNFFFAEKLCHYVRSRTHDV